MLTFNFDSLSETTEQRLRNADPSTSTVVKILQKKIKRHFFFSSSSFSIKINISQRMNDIWNTKARHTHLPVSPCPLPPRLCFHSSIILSNKIELPFSFFIHCKKTLGWSQILLTILSKMASVNYECLTGSNRNLMIIPRKLIRRLHFLAPSPGHWKAPYCASTFRHCILKSNGKWLLIGQRRFKKNASVFFSNYPSRFLGIRKAKYKAIEINFLMHSKRLMVDRSIFNTCVKRSTVW